MDNCYWDVINRLNYNSWSLNNMIEAYRYEAGTGRSC